MEILERGKRIAERLKDGRLPREKSAQLWAGFGKGRACDGCGETIAASDVEHEHDLVSGAIVRFHAACSVLWTRMTTEPPTT
jgi:hypothetical protein